MAPIQEYRRGRYAILCEHSGDRPADVGHAEGQIEQAWLFDPTMDSRGLKPQRCRDTHVL